MQEKAKTGYTVKAERGDGIKEVSFIILFYTLHIENENINLVKRNNDWAIE